MTGFRPLKKPATFLCLFTLTAGLLLPLWSYLSQFYLTALTIPVNYGLKLAGMPVEFQAHQLIGHDIVYPGVVAAVALFVATPDYSPGWKTRWLAVLIPLLWALHASLLYLETDISIPQYLNHLPSANRHPLLDHLLSPVARDALLGRLVALGKMWGTPVVILLTWFFAVRRCGRPAANSSTAS